ncbi:hypothetical protein [Sphingomonas sp. ABOLF]|uniref:hypothetical protein n=1 Tax=Sphingomonas sp. ABOLF TaxID=1985879 RepID=UPI000F7F794F|nr:hypothetical protein [Sphingomonas sp. ABOLF]
MSKDDDLRWRLDLLKKALDDGKISVAPHLAEGVKSSLNAVQLGPDGLIDLSTVDGRIRSMALAVAGLHQRDETKNLISLHEVQRRYFEFIDHTFGDLHKFMRVKGTHAQAVAWMLSQDPEAVDANYRLIAPFMEQLTQFWSTAGESCEYHIQDLRTIKGFFGGDLFPSYQRNIASSTGLYLDTIILTDPFMNSRRMFELWEPAIAVRYFVKHGLNVLGYRDLALAELDPPIVVVVPFKSSFDENEAEQVMRMSELGVLSHGAALFGRSFTDIDDLHDFADHLDTVEKAVAAIKRPDRFLIDTDWSGSVSEQITRAVNEKVLGVDIQHPGMILFSQCTGRMRQATDVLLKSRNLLGTPLVEAETSWKYLNWKLEYDAVLSPGELVPLHMVKGLQRAGATDLEWIGDIPPEALIEMRREGALQEIREVISNGVAEVAEANPINFFRSADRIVDNVQDAFAKHQENVRELRSKGLKFWGKDIGSWIVKGSIEIGAALAGTPVMGLAVLGVDQVLDSPKLNELPSRYRALQAARVRTR